MSWKVQKSLDAGIVIFKISGRLQEGQLAELQRILGSEPGHRECALDLKGVKLVDQESVSFLAGCETDGAKLLNCAPYIREWITRVKSGG